MLPVFAVTPHDAPSEYFTMAPTMGLGVMEAVLALAFFFGGPLGLPVSVPPLPPDPVIERSAPQECLLHVATRGVAEPAAESANLTEKLLANPEVREFVGRLAESLIGAVKQSPAAAGPAAEAIDHGIVLLGTIAAQPASLTVSSVSLDPAAGPPAVEAAVVVKCGDQSDKVKGAIDGLLALAFEGAPEGMRPKPVQIGGRQWSRLVLPVGVPITWGFGGKYFILTAGGDATAKLLERLGDMAAKPPAWKVALEKRMPRERLSTLSFLDVRRALRIAADLPKLGGPRIPAGVLEATGLAKLETVGAVTGLSAEGFAASLWLGIDGEPTGMFAPPAGGVRRDALRSVPQDAIMAQSWKLDLAKTVAAGIDLVGRLDPDAAANATNALDQLGRVVGMDVTRELLEPLGADWSFFIGQGGGLMPAMAVQVSLDDRAAFEKAHDRLLQLAGAEAGNAGVAVRKVDYRGHAIHCLKAVGAAPLPFTPTWCLAKDRLVVTSSPQVMKTLLSRPADEAGIDAIPEVKRATAEGREAMVGYLEPTGLVRTLFSLYEMGVPFAETGLAQEQIPLRLPELPAASAVMPYVRPSVTVVRWVKGPQAGILVESTATLPLGPLSSGGGLVGGAPISGPVVVGLLLPAVQSAREAARRAAVGNNLTQIMLAMFRHSDANNRLPAPAICSKEGKPLLSWRVAMLPYLGEQALYERFHLDEPWDSEHNKKLIPLMPQVFSDPAATPEEIAAGLTPYQMLRGEKTAFAKDAEGPRMDAITDGLSKTLGIVEVARDKVVPWTKPQDLPFDADKPFAGLGTDRRPGKMFGAAFLDGQFEMLSPDDVPPEAVKAMATANAGDRRDE
jgi:hypothetical protein